jgi:MFS transporter, ACS family, D-galactonate transporter
MAKHADVPTSLSVAAVARESLPVRYGILALLCGCVAINYLDRALLGVSLPRLEQDLALSPAAAGVLLSAFSWTYFLAQVPAGLLLDRLSVRRLYVGSLFSWSLVTGLHALAGGLRSLFGLRLLLGVAEAPCFPANNTILAKWFPTSERARAVSLYTAAEYVGLSFLSPLLYWALSVTGWRTLFLGAGVLGMAYSALFARRYRDPQSHAAVSTSELQHIGAGGGLIQRVAPVAFTLAALRGLLSRRRIWGLCLGQFAVHSTLTFFLTWFPSYLITARHINWLQAGLFAVLPYAAAFCGILVAGWTSDRLLARGFSLSFARKSPVIAGLVLATGIVAANWVESNELIVLILAVAFFAQGMSGSSWAVISEIAPAGQLGLVGGLFNASGNLAGIVTPIAIGAIVQSTQSFVDALYFVGLVALVGAAAWIFIVGPIEPLSDAAAE